MPRKVKKKYHYLYRTTNMINGKYYVGIHSTYKIKDGYLGSGTRLWNAIYKYGKENFVKEELEFFENREELLQREKEIVNEQLLQDPLCMNLQPGGGGGFSSEEHRLKCSLAGTNSPNRTKKSAATLRKRLKNKKYKEEFSRKISDALPRKNGKIVGNCAMLGKKHSNETIQKMKNVHSGKNNSSYGTCWIFNEIEKVNKKINKKDLKHWINLGWQQGRKIK